MSKKDQRVLWLIHILASKKFDQRKMIIQAYEKGLSRGLIETFSSKINKKYQDKYPLTWLTLNSLTMGKTEFDSHCISKLVENLSSDKSGRELEFLLEILLGSSFKDKNEIKISFESK